MAAMDVDTVIFVDVDGVLNVGAMDEGNPPLLWHQKNIDCARRMYAENNRHKSIETVLSIAAHKVKGEELAPTYESLSCDKSDCSAILVSRLAEILQMAGERREVVLSSNWRNPQHAGRVKRLEEEVSYHLGEPFAFDAKTAVCAERTAADRLVCIGDYVATLAKQRGSIAGHLRVLILEDFFISPIDGWHCGGAPMNSVQACEKYIVNRGASMDFSVKLVHTYDEWHTSSGLRVQLGAGLSRFDVQAAKEFLVGCHPHGDGKPRPQPPPMKKQSKLSQLCHMTVVGRSSNGTRKSLGNFSHSVTQLFKLLPASMTTQPKRAATDRECSQKQFTTKQDLVFDF
jgi:hypothetical protein